MKKPVYPMLAGEIAKRGIRKYEIASDRACEVREIAVLEMYAEMVTSARGG